MKANYIDPILIRHLTSGQFIRTSKPRTCAHDLCVLEVLKSHKFFLKNLRPKAKTLQKAPLEKISGR